MVPDLSLERLYQTMEVLTRSFAAEPSVRAMFVGGSVAAGRADAYSDLDLYLLARAPDFEEVAACSRRCLESAGELLFYRRVEHGFVMDVFIYAHGVRGELGIGTPQELGRLHFGHYQVLFDRDGLLPGYTFPGFGPGPGPDWTVDSLEWFWRAALLAQGYLARGDLWSAAAALEDMRRRAAALLWQGRNPSGAVEMTLHRLGALAAEVDLEPLRASLVPLEARAMRQALDQLCGWGRQFVSSRVRDGLARTRLLRLAALADPG